MINIAVLGAGRMGRQITQVVHERPDCEVTGIWSRREEGPLQSGNLSLVLENADVAIDFTLPAATDKILDAMIERNIPLVCGVSGLDSRQTGRLRDAAESIAILHDRNMSMGIALLARFVAEAGEALGPEFEAEIHETHHIHKIDAPSGTALQLGERLAASRGQILADVYQFVEGNNSPGKSSDTIRFFSERRGEIPGDHSVIFRSGGETISLHHSVSDRRIFAEGAVAAARFLAEKSRGYFCMADVLNLR